MTRNIPRRTFLKTSAIASAGCLLQRQASPAPLSSTTLHKALVMGRPNEKGLQQLKDAGFEGIECNAWDVRPEDAEASRKLADSLGMRIHSVMRGWCQFNDADPTKVEASVAGVDAALRTAKAYGADALLVVPCRIGGMPMPKPWEFDIEFDPATCHVTRVAKGDNTGYAAYIEAHNRATDMSRAALQKLIPTATETGVAIAVENVWNNLWVHPDIFAAFVRSHESPCIRAYFDIGNHVRYALPENWIRALGDLIVKCHVKDFTLNENGQGGKWANIRDGSVDWPLVRRELDKAGYNGWMTIEGSGGLSVEERSKRLDQIVAGA